jgi:hypothetical protein
MKKLRKPYTCMQKRPNTPLNLSFSEEGYPAISPHSGRKLSFDHRKSESDDLQYKKRGQKKGD